MAGKRQKETKADVGRNNLIKRGQKQKRKREREKKKEKMKEKYKLECKDRLTGVYKGRESKKERPIKGRIEKEEKKGTDR